MIAKRRLEREAIQLFVRQYNQTADSPLRLLYQREKPDAVLMDSLGRKLGMEITHLFYSEEEARQLFQQRHRSFVCIDSFQHLLDGLNQQLARKEAKSAGYSRKYPLALLIRNMSPHFGWSDFNQAWDKITFSSQAFAHVWLLVKDDAPQDSVAKDASQGSALQDAASAGPAAEQWHLRRL